MSQRKKLNINVDSLLAMTDVVIVSPWGSIDSDIRVLFRELSQNFDILVEWRERTVSLFTDRRQKQIRDAIYDNPSINYINWKLLHSLLCTETLYFKTHPDLNRLVKITDKEVKLMGETLDNRNVRMSRVMNPSKHKCLFFYAEILVEQHESCNMSFGVVDQYFCNSSGFVGFGNKSSRSYGYSSDGSMRCSSSNNTYNAPEWQDKGTWIGQLVDFTSNTIKFFKNGEYVPYTMHCSFKPIDHFFAVTIYQGQDWLKIRDQIDIDFVKFIYPLIKALPHQVYVP
jgi:hypothetical protein